MTSHKEIQRLAQQLAQAPADQEAGEALCAALMRRGHGPDSVKLALYNTGLLTRIMMTIVTDQAARGHVKASVEGLVRSLREDARDAGVFDLVAPLITDHEVGVTKALGGESVTSGHLVAVDVALDLEAYQVARPTQNPAFIDDVEVGGYLSVVAEGRVDVFFVRALGRASAQWVLTSDVYLGGRWVTAPTGSLLVIVDGVTCEEAWVGSETPTLSFKGSAFSILTPRDIRTSLHLERIG